LDGDPHNLEDSHDYLDALVEFVHALLVSAGEEPLKIEPVAPRKQDWLMLSSLLMLRFCSDAIY